MEVKVGWVNCRKEAFARFRSTEEAEVASAAIVGMQGLSDAIHCRSSRRGSCSVVSEELIVMLVWCWVVSGFWAEG
jgi:hypothetical protein